MRIVATALGLSLFLASCASSGSERDSAPPEAGAELGAAGQDTPPPGSEDYLDSQWERLTLAEQKKVFLVEQHIRTARDLVDRLQLEQAELEVARALELDPDNVEAQEVMAQVGTLLGRPAGESQTVVQTLEEQYVLQKQQAEADARDKLQKARMLMGREEYDAAITELTLCLDQVKWSPYSGDWADIESEATQLLDNARAQLEAKAQADRETAQRRAREELRAQELAESERRSRVVAGLMDEAIQAFRSNEFDAAIEYADRVLRIDPRNERAADLRDTAFRKGRDLVQDDFLRRKKEQYLRWQEELEELRIPYQGVITLPDPDRWNEITEMRAGRPGLDYARTVPAGEVELRQQLGTVRIPGLKVEDEESLTTVIDSVRLITGLPMVVDPAGEQAALDEGVVFDIELTNPLTVEKALNLITETAGEEVTWTVRHDTVLVTTKDKARGAAVIANHDVQDLIFGLTDFLGPRIARLRLVDELEDDDGGGPFGAIGEKPTIIEPDDLATLVQENVAVDTWDGDGVSIVVEGGHMVVVQTPEVQQQIRTFLDELRRFSASLVTIESKFLTIKDGFIQEIGVDFRGLDNPGVPFTDLDDVNLGLDPTVGLDNSGDGVTLTPPSAGAFLDEGGDGAIAGRSENFFGSALGSALSTVGGLSAQYTLLNDLNISAILTLVEKSQNIELINDQLISVHNTQRAYVTVVNQRAYVQDFDVEVAQFQAIADPIINVLTEGIVMDVRPTIHHSRQYLTLEIQPTVAQVVALTDFSTTLSGSTAAVTFQLPELEVSSVFTTAVVPDGGSILIGGLSRLRNVERRAEVPWLANIPLVGFFFKEEGYNDERESLMIMIKAWITDVRDQLAGFEGR